VDTVAADVSTVKPVQNETRFKLVCLYREKKSHTCCQSTISVQAARYLRPGHYLHVVAYIPRQNFCPVFYITLDFNVT
jgi:hypothetical protein